MKEFGFGKFLNKFEAYRKAKTLVERWNLLSVSQKKDAADLKRAFNWPVDVAIQQVFFFGNTVERERRLFPNGR